MRVIRQLDGLRGIAIILVLLDHIPFIDGSVLLNSIKYVAVLAKAGYLGVDIFFVLSGFLITRGLHKHLRENRQNTIKNFYARRFLRIFPIYYLTISVCWLAFPTFDYLYQLFYLSNYHFAFDLTTHPLRQTWSLAVEEQFYLLFPWLLLVLHKTNRLSTSIIVVMFVSIVSAILVEISFDDGIATNYIYRSLEHRMLSLSIGAYFAIVGVPKLPLLKGSIIILMIYLFLSILLVLNNMLSLELRLATVKQVAFSTVSAMLFVVSYQSRGWLKQVLECSPLRYTGKISYGLYLYHLPLFFAMGISHMQVESGSTTSFRAVVIGVGILIAVSAASWHFVERPILAFKKDFY